MKILMITPTYFPYVSGNSVCAKRIGLGLKKLGHDVLVQTPKTINHDEIKEFDPDIIHGLHAYKCRIVLKLSTVFNIPYILTLTGSDYEECLIDSVNFEKSLGEENIKRITLDVMRKASYLVVYNKKTSNRIAKKFPQFTSKLRVIGKGLPIIGSGDLNFRKTHKIKDNDFVFSLVSGIRVRKNNFCPIESLSELRKRYPNIVLTFIGPAIEKEYDLELQKKIRGLKWVRYIGVVPIDQMRQVYLESDVILNCSHYEGESNAIIEAMYYGKALLISKAPGNIPLVNDGVDGLLFDVNDAEDFIKKAEKLINDSHLRNNLEDNAKKKSLTLLNVNESKDYEDLYLKAALD